MKTIFNLFWTTFIISLSAQASLSNNDGVWDLGESYRILVIKDIIAPAKSKNIFIQNNNLLTAGQVNKKQPFCVLENVRDRDQASIHHLKAGTLFKPTNDFMNGWEKYFSYRIWQKSLLFWDNGYYQAFTCNANMLGLDHPFEWNHLEFKRHVGKFLKIQRP
jgi:hypothetical protein